MRCGSGSTEKIIPKCSQVTGTVSKQTKLFFYSKFLFLCGTVYSPKNNWRKWIGLLILINCYGSGSIFFTFRIRIQVKNTFFSKATKNWSLSDPDPKWIIPDPDQYPANNFGFDRIRLRIHNTVSSYHCLYHCAQFNCEILDQILRVHLLCDCTFFYFSSCRM